MATARVKLVRNTLPSVSATNLALLTDAPLPEPHNRWEVFTGVAALWPLFRDDILANWIALHPGSRPSCWWRFDSPEPRQRLGGIGTASHDALAYTSSFAKGIPDSWLTASDAAFYFPEGLDDGVQAFDADNAPQFESEAVYLRRLKLFAPGEARRIKKSQYAPERITWKEPQDDDE